MENEINRYFTHAIGYYFGENAFAIRMQAFDDMLWVVLGWLEAMKFIKLHSEIHYDIKDEGEDAWYGEQYVPAFAHRARIFYGLARRGWDTELCGGGMVWNPRLLPYKNAITNELYIAASASMYLYFPGDNISSPYTAPQHPPPDHIDQKTFQMYHEEDETIATSAIQYDRSFLNAAIEGYDWLKNSNMTYSRGLYVDGFHIKDYGVNGTIGTGKCDERNEMVYTYNQGVLLSGLRALWEGTGNITYLSDGHQLVRNVIAATGWRLFDEPHLPPGRHEKWKWHGLGRAGILEDVCDASGRCNQDGQTFKGIFFHHLTLFCEPLPEIAKAPGKTFAGDREIRMMHKQSCVEYAPWVVRNAKAALRTRDEKGRFGMWWAAGIGWDEDMSHWTGVEGMSERLPKHAVDLRNGLEDERTQQWWPAEMDEGRSRANRRYEPIEFDENAYRDPNDRGRGRTVETQGGGVAVLRAMWELVRLSESNT